MTTIGVIRWPATGAAMTANTLFVREAPTLRTSYSWRQPKQGWAFSGLSQSAMQAQVDQEITWAARAGIDYFAYDWYPDQNPPNIAEKVILDSYTRHAASSLATLVKRTLILVPNEGPGGGMGAVNKQIPTYWRSTYVPWLVGQMQTAGWQTVTIGGVVRPLLYIFGSALWAGSAGFGSTASANTEFQYLRDQCTAAGLNNPYLVDVKYETTLALDGVSGYGVFNGNFAYGSSGWTGQLSNARMRQGDTDQWAATVPSGRGLIPGVISAANPRPRFDASSADPANWSWASFYGYYGDNHTYRQWEDHVSAALAFVRANPTKCPADSILIGAWDEIEESGAGIVPFLPSDTTGKGFAFLNGIRAAKTGIKPSTYVNSWNGDRLDVTRSGVWANSSGLTGGQWQNDEIYTLATNAYLEVTDRAIGFEWWASKGPDRGIAEVLIDGASQGLVDLYAASNAGTLRVFSKFGLASGVNHTIRIRHTGTFNVLNTAGYAVVPVDVIHATCRR